MKKILLMLLLLLFTPCSFSAESVQYEKSDPTKNVMDLVNSSIRRIDDLQELQTKAITEMFTIQNKAMDDKLSMFMVNSKDLAAAEKSRVDAIRSVDVSAFAIDRERATTQAQVLAAQVQASAENLRLLVATTAEATAKQNQSAMADLAKRITDVEKIQNASIGASGGMRDFWGYVIGAVGVMIAVSQYLILRNKQPGVRS